MSESIADRWLAAILAADVAGYNAQGTSPSHRRADIDVSRPHAAAIKPTSQVVVAAPRRGKFVETEIVL